MVTVPEGVITPVVYDIAVGMIVFPTVVFVSALAITPTVHPAEVPRVSATVTEPIETEIVDPALAVPRLKVAGTEIVRLPAVGGGVDGVETVSVTSVARACSATRSDNPSAAKMVRIWISFGDFRMWSSFR